MKPEWDFATKAIHSGFSQDEGNGATAVPIYETAAFAYDSAEEIADVFCGRRFGHIYSRISNPTVAAFERRVNSLENGRGAIATSSGLAAIATVIYTLCRPGDEIVASKSLFGGTLQLFEEIFQNFGVKVKYVRACDYDGYERSVTCDTRLIFVETIGNPGLDVPDVWRISQTAAAAGIPLVVDSTLSTPYLFEAKKFGANVIVHSASKYMTGTGTTVGGILVDLGNFNWTKTSSPAVREKARKAGDYAFLARARAQVLQNTGSCLSPFNAYLHNQGLETLSLRMDKHCENAMKLAEYFSTHPKVNGTNYPGLAQNIGHETAKTQFGGRYGALLTIRLGSREQCFNLVRKLKLVKNLANLGDAKTLVIHPASTIFYNIDESVQAEAGVFSDLLRISVGIENIRDIICDFEQALTE